MRERQTVEIKRRDNRGRWEARKAGSIEEYNAGHRRKLLEGRDAFTRSRSRYYIGGIYPLITHPKQRIHRGGRSGDVPDELFRQ